MPEKGSPEWIKAEQAALVKKNKSPMPWLIMLGAFILIVVVVVVGGVVHASRSHDNSTSAVDDKYVQTWQSDYSETTCDDWTSTMTAEQKFAAAADILASARNKIDGGSGLPSDSLIDEFRDGITNVCVLPTMTLTDATYGLYSTEPRFHP